jgi:N-acetylglucosaminyldiphosphoundecaprenol N-acetyl-beta-D-mannosaminyltransferase
LTVRTTNPGLDSSASRDDDFLFGGLTLAPLTLDRVVQWVVDRANAERAAVVISSHISHLMLAAKSAQFRAVMAASELNVADGWPLVAASRLLHPPLPARVIGIDLVEHVLRSGSRFRVAILGGPPGTAGAMAERERERHDIVIVEPMPVGVWDTPEALEAMFERVRNANPNLVLIGLGVPKQELLAEQLRPCVSGPILCCGAAIPVLGGSVRRAPAFVRRLGAEWVFRICQEPVRMTPRYVQTGSWFLRAFIHELRRRDGSVVGTG